MKDKIIRPGKLKGVSKNSWECRNMAEDTQGKQMGARMPKRK